MPGCARACENPKHMHFGRYGGRGISVCDRWRRSFADFVADMGPRPDGHTLDRVNNDGNYEPDNCRWATRKQQSNNRDSARGERSGNSKLTESTVLAIRAAVSAGGFTQQQIASRFGISRASIYYVVRRLSWKHVPLASSSATRAGGSDNGAHQEAPRDGGWGVRRERGRHACWVEQVLHSDRHL
jgi:hypothetical protein